jgi:hypothetical protein
MKRISCPYLGLKDDPTTALGFPSPGNHCHQGRPISPVKGAHQEKYCLTAEYTGCPVYQASHPVPLPAAIAAKPPPILNGRQVMALLGIPALIVAAAAIFYAWNTFGNGLSLIRQIPNTGPLMGDFSFQLLGGQPQPISTLTPFSPLVSGSIAQTPTASCPMPENWIPYTVNPTDSLFRLSVIYGVSIEQLQQANCLGDKTLILPGQAIYIPFIPTDTPISSDTSVPPAPLQPNTQPPAPPPAAATPTSAPPPEKDPTETPVPATNTAAPPGTSLPPTSTNEPGNTPQPTDFPPPTPDATDIPPPIATDPPTPPPTDTVAPPLTTATGSPPQTTTEPPTTTTPPLPPEATTTGVPISTNLPPTLVATEPPTTTLTSSPGTTTTTP